MNTKNNEVLLDVVDVMKVIPHRYPFLLVDSILEIETGKSVVGKKCVTINEQFFQGHFPGKPVMPGVLIVEGMAQCASFVPIDTEKLNFEMLKDTNIFFMSVDKVKFRAPVLPGEVILYKVELINHRNNVWNFKGMAYINNGEKLACEANFKIFVERQVD